MCSLTLSTPFPVYPMSNKGHSCSNTFKKKKDPCDATLKHYHFYVLPVVRLWLGARFLKDLETQERKPHRAKLQHCIEVKVPRGKLRQGVTGRGTVKH